MLWPSPSKVYDFNPLPSSVKSRLDGDVWQIPNLMAYFSNNYRDTVVPFYLSEYWDISNLPFPPMKLNHPPEFSWNTIRKHTDSTYLEELIYPLRDSLYINGFEPFNPDGSDKFWGSGKFLAENQEWFTKTTIRFYSSSFFVRLVVWFGISVSILLLYKCGRKIIFNE